MKIQMGKNLTLIITPETWEEFYALEKWGDEYFLKNEVNKSDAFILIEMKEFADGQK